jgi:hypothetical protein
VLRRRYGDHGMVETTLSRIQPGYHSVMLPGTAWGDEPVIISEFGGITCPADGDKERWRGYGAAADGDELLERYRVLVDALLDSPASPGSATRSSPTCSKSERSADCGARTQGPARIGPPHHAASGRRSACGRDRARRVCGPPADVGPRVA